MNNFVYLKSILLECFVVIISKIIFLVFITPCSNLASQNYFTYHSLINEAESNWGDEKFEQSLLIYDSVFSSFDYVYLKDYIIAAQISFIAGDSTRLLKYLNSSIKAGYSCDCLLKLPIFNTLDQYSFWKEVVKSEEILKKEYRSRIKWELNSEFNSRFIREQKYKRNETKDLYRKITRNNIIRIENLMDEMLFPSERIIGFDGSGMGINFECRASNSKVLATILHSNNFLTRLGIDRFVLAIKKGYLHPNQFGNIFTFEKYSVSTIGDMEFEVKLPDYIFNFPFGEMSNDLSRVNEDRMAFGICTIDCQRRKNVTGKKYKIVHVFGYK